MEMHTARAAWQSAVHHQQLPSAQHVPAISMSHAPPAQMLVLLQDPQPCSLSWRIGPFFSHVILLVVGVLQGFPGNIYVMQDVQLSTGMRGSNPYRFPCTMALTGPDILPTVSLPHHPTCYSWLWCSARYQLSCVLCLIMCVLSYDELSRSMSETAH